MPNITRWSLSNPGPAPLHLWLEPWADEFEIPARSTVTLEAPVDGDFGEFEWTPDHLVLWATAPTVTISIDHVPQASASATVPIPPELTKDMLGLLFAKQPAARLAGRPLERASDSWWRKIARPFSRASRN